MSQDSLSSLERRLLAALIGAAFVLRAVYCWKFPQWGPGGSIPDLNWYETIAESLYRHGVIADPYGNLTAAREPGYPMLLAATYLLTGPSYRAGQALNCLFGCLTVLLIFSMGRSIFGRRTGWLAAGIAAFYPQFLYYTATLERETFQTFLLALAVWLILRAARAPSWKAWALPGLAAAACALTNSALLPAGLMLAPAIWFLGRRQGRSFFRGAIVYLGMMLLVCALWPLRNERIFHRFILGINGGGAHMYIGIIVPNDAAGTPAEAAFVDNDPVNREAMKLPEAERDRVFYRGAFRFIRERPLRYAGVALRSLAKLWRLYPYARAYAYHYGLIKWVGLLSDGWIIPLGFFGMFLAGRRFPETDLFLSVVFSVSFTYMLFWSIIRYRLPMMPFMILFCAHALNALAARFEGEESVKRFDGKTVLITGAGRGIGRALALGFAREGASLILCSRTAAELESAAAEARALGARVRAQTCDISVAAQVASFVAAGLKEFGRIDVLINNAGVLGPIKPLAEVSDADWRAVLAANLDSVFYVTREVLRSSRGKACVINVSSGQGRKASAGWGPYAASKFGLEGLTQAWAEEGKERGVRFYSLNPTATRTKMRAQAVPGEDPASLKAPESVVEAFMTLASDDCPLPTGSAAWLNRETGKLES